MKQNLTVLAVLATAAIQPIHCLPGFNRKGEAPQILDFKSDKMQKYIEKHASQPAKSTADVHQRFDRLLSKQAEKEEVLAHLGETQSQMTGAYHNNAIKSVSAMLRTTEDGASKLDPDALKPHAWVNHVSSNRAADSSARDSLMNHLREKIARKHRKAISQADAEKWKKKSVAL